jgi:hypothetical protein
MVRTTSRFRSALAVALVLSLPNSGCYAAHYQRLEPNASLDDVTGLTMRSGREIPFAMPGATIEKDTLVASGSVGQVRVPTDSIARVTRHGFSIGRTALLFGGVAAVATAALVLASLRSFSIP